MDRVFRHIEVERRGDVFCVRPRRQDMDEASLDGFGEEINHLIKDEGCRKLVLVLGPDSLFCLYSIFLAKLVSVQRRLHLAGGALKLAQVPPAVLDIFDACRLRSLFDFSPDVDAAVQELSRSAARMTS
jgi:anti-anti-sigma factor